MQEATAETLSAARPTPGAARAVPGRYWSRAGGLLFTFAALIIVVSAAFVAYDLHDRRRQALQVGFASADNLGHVIEVQAAQALQAATLTMQHLRNAVRLMPRGRQAADEGLHIQMKSAVDVMDHVRALFILDENGVLVHDSDAFPARRGDLSDRRYFTAHRDDPARGLYIGPLILGRTAGKTYISVSLRVEKPGGGFGGVIVAALDPEYFQKLYASINVGRNGVVALLLSDGTLLARAPHLPDAVGKPAPDPVYLARIRSGKPYELFEARSGYDGVERLVSYRRVPGLPLACVVGLDREGVLAQWRAHAEQEILLEIAFALTILMFAYVGARQLRRAETLTRAVSASEQNYRQLFHANPLPMWIRNPVTHRFLDVNEAAVASYGYGREEFLGLNSTDLIPEQDRAQWQRYLARAPREGVLFRAGRHRRKDGSVFDVEVTSRSIDYEGAPARLSLAMDVTERHRAEAALRESHYFMQKAQEVAHIGYWVSGPSQSGASLVWSPESHSIFGIPKERFDGRVESFFSLVHPEDLERVKAESAASLAGERQYRVEHRIVRPDGSVRWVYQEADVTFDADGRPLEMFGVTQDITERKQAELRVRESEGRYRFMFEGNPMPMWVRDAANGGFIDVNEAAMSLYGYTREEFLGLSGEDIRPESDREEWREFVRHRDKMERTVKRWRHRRKNGEPIEVEVTSRGFMHEGRPARLAMIKDVTEQARAERALRESEERYRSLIEMSPSPIVLHESETVILANSAALQFFGAQSEGDLVGGSYLALVHPDEHARVRERIAYMERTLERVPSEVRKFRRLDGRFVFGETSAACLPHEGRLLGIATIHDVTARIEAERALRDSAQTIQQLNAELERRVKDRTAQLEATNRELEAFAYSVSHDLRAPLRSIDGFSKALLEDYAGKLDADGEDYLGRIRNATLRMSNLINDLLALSRVARSEMRNDEVDLSALAREIVAELRRQDPARKVQTAIQASLRARGDPELLRIMLQNLLENAWKFTVRTPGAKLEVGAEARDGCETFYVRDNGVGFDMAYAGNLFGAFQRLHAASDFPGTGIGLATVQRIVRRHGGEVRADAGVGKGATFYFTLGG